MSYFSLYLDKTKSVLGTIALEKNNAILDFINKLSTEFLKGMTPNEFRYHSQSNFNYF